MNHEQLKQLEAALVAVQKLQANSTAAAKVAEKTAGQIKGFIEQERAEPLEAPQPPPAPQSPPVSASPPPTPPAPVPVPPAAPSTSRTRNQVTRIILEEFAKQTSFVPGGANGTATAAEIVDPARAVQLWTNNLIGLNALEIPETNLRAMVGAMFAVDVKRYGWEQSHPPTPGGANLPNSLFVTITGQAELPSR